MHITSAKNHKEAVIELLTAEKLPTADLPDELDNFIVATEDNAITGVAGIELYGNYGLLRSVATAKAFRNKGIAQGLLDGIEDLAKTTGLQAIYLLTETAPEYFKKKGFVQIERTAIPAEVQRSSEFSHVCPVSAIAMVKTIKQ